MFPVGSSVEYFSQTNGGWISQAVQGHHSDGWYILDVQDEADPRKVRLPVKALAEYFSVSSGNVWIPAIVKGHEVVGDDLDFAYVLDVKSHAPPEKVRARSTMAVQLEKYPQENPVIQHWALRVGGIVYEYEREGYQSGAHTTCDFGHAATIKDLGRTTRTHSEIQDWAMQNFGDASKYNAISRNCQDFALQLGAFLGISQWKFPWRQVFTIPAAVAVSAVVAPIPTAIGTGFVIGGSSGSANSSGSSSTR